MRLKLFDDLSVAKANLKKKHLYATLMCMNAQNIDWQAIQTAYQVAQSGTLSAAADALGIHHSTVLRRINSLEKAFGTPLFYRHPRGYVPTEAGQLLTQAAEQSHEQFDRLLGQLQGQDVQLSGTLMITTVNTMADLLMPMLADFQQLYPKIRLEYAADSRIYKLEHGEAHVSIRPGTKPNDPDYVVQPLGHLATTLYGNSRYLAQHGLIESLDDVLGHHFISTSAPYSMVPFMHWLNNDVAPEQIVLRCNDFNSFLPAVRAGLGAAPLHCWQAEQESGLYPLLPPPPPWQIPLWLSTHRDLHRTPKVQAMSQFLKQRFNSLPV